ncbi:PstS family phosphate ABC transporter substrate-binding protein [Salinicoccus sp. ID82-1]|uniref:PstS family phosphate ABC transporter substrate-binding protein n=1 Tax=Salinicoccus sp. ID82-1 TaxID=2820269 RepID=UPI001F305F5B|nr:PstS family phosphate ABC transporter substrate-binding protein [Salinicoccus sp. ID82-1]MCG1009003.1 PstS family phosphate ABC transporter substrate-binding protein [Salinicoccus sp. ID82-1]
MKKSMFMAALLMSLMFILAACGGGSGGSSDESTEEASTEESTEETTESSEASSEETTEGSLSGTVTGDGSSTVAPILELINEDFNAEYPDVEVAVGVSGTGGGFEKFIAGETDFQNASREIQEEEITALEDAGIEYTEFKVANDGLTVAVNTENDFVDYLTFEELRMIYSGEATSWSDVRADFPDEEITAYAPDQSHGTHDFFKEVVMEDADIQAQLNQDTNVISQSVASDANSIGFFGYNFYMVNQDNLKGVPIQGPETEEPVEVSDETVMSYEYPLARPLFVYAKNEALQNNEAFLTFMEFTLNNASSAAEEAGYVALTEEEMQEQMDKLAEFQ